MVGYFDHGPLLDHAIPGLVEGAVDSIRDSCADRLTLLVVQPVSPVVAEQMIGSGFFDWAFGTSVQGTVVINYRSPKSSCWLR
jgi:hypothetical protein